MGRDKEIMSELLLELFSEEIPAMMQRKAAQSYKEIFEVYFQKNHVEFDNVKTYVGPRRLVVHVTGLASSAASSVKEIKGPKISAAEMRYKDFVNQIKQSKSN